MARMHSRKKGKSGSKRPIKKQKPSWFHYSEKEVEQLILKYARLGMPPSKIGVYLRDVYGIPDVKIITGKKITQILSENKLQQELPEDILALIKKEITILGHLEKNNKDMPSKRGLQLTESKIRRLTKYYKGRGILPDNWKYDHKKAKLITG
ncbi:30S ribosomal protein S15 [Candidatus Woesearchaeota archaeon]|nr:30S ribosomal protein S15 [Candidatus Woesearchaeota archaeon]